MRSHFDFVEDVAESVRKLSLAVTTLPLRLIP